VPRPPSSSSTAWSRARRRSRVRRSRGAFGPARPVELHAARHLPVQRSASKRSIPRPPRRVPLLEPQWNGRRTRARSAKWASSCRRRSTERRSDGRTAVAPCRIGNAALAPARQATAVSESNVARVGARMTRMDGRQRPTPGNGAAPSTAWASARRGLAARPGYRVSGHHTPTAVRSATGARRA